MDVVVAEVAEKEFERFMDSMDLDFDVDSMDEEDQKAFKRKRHIVVRAIRRGHLAVNDNGECVYNVQSEGDHEPLTLREPKGSVWISMAKKGNEAAKINAFLGEITGKNSNYFVNLNNRDCKVLHTVAVLFLA